eukprot:scaffold523281_cov63-Attheya_sp.AAC.1
MPLPQTAEEKSLGGSLSAFNGYEVQPTDPLETEDSGNTHSLPEIDPRSTFSGGGGSSSDFLPPFLRERTKHLDKEQKLTYGLFASVALIIVLLISLIVSSVNNGNNASSPSPASASSPRAPGPGPTPFPGSYQCPQEVGKAENDVDDYYKIYKRDASNLANDGALENYAMVQYDGFGPNTYIQIKSLLSEWKKRHFCGVLKSGDRIYESASGSGFNLHMSLEILLECNVRVIEVEGNDYVPQNVVNANTFFNGPVRERAKSHYFCHADSLHLDHVPSNTFSLVYTGFMDPIVDPLNLFPGLGISQRMRELKDICSSQDRHQQLLVTLDQDAQDEYHSNFVMEMIRIAKPGAPIILEFVSHAACSATGSLWGGVNINFWMTGANKFGWDIDPNTEIDMYELELNGDERYNVRMLKNK